MLKTKRKYKPRRLEPFDEVDLLLEQIRSGVVRVPVERPGKPKAVLISEQEHARLVAIDKSPHAEIIGRLLFAPRG